MRQAAREDRQLLFKAGRANVSQSLLSRLSRIAGVTVALADQGSQSVASLTLTILVARQLESSDFGKWAITIVVLTGVWGLVRTILVEPFLITQASRPPNMVRQEARKLQTFLILGFSGPASLCLSIGFALDDIWRDAFVFVGLAFIPVAVLECARAIAIASSDHQRTILIGCTWLLALGAGVLMTGGSPSFRESLIIAWTAIATASLWGVHSLLTSERHRPLTSSTEFTDGFSYDNVRSIGFPLAPEFGLTVLSTQALVPLIGAVGTVSAAAGFRGATAISGPMSTLIGGLRLGILADATRFDGESTETNWWRYFVQGCGLLGLASLPLATALWLGTKSIGVELLGPTWPLAEPLVLPILGTSLLSIPHLIGLSILRARKETQMLLKIRIATTIAILVPAGSGAVVAGERGAAYGYFFGMVLSLPLWITPMWRSRSLVSSK